MKLEDIHIGDKVCVPSVKNNISRLCRTGTVTAIMKPYCRVHIKYGRFYSGNWHGYISEVEKI